MAIDTVSSMTFEEDLRSKGTSPEDGVGKQGRTFIDRIDVVRLPEGMRHYSAGLPKNLTQTAVSVIYSFP